MSRPDEDSRGFGFGPNRKRSSFLQCFDRDLGGIDFSKLSDHVREKAKETKARMRTSRLRLISAKLSLWRPVARSMEKSVELLDYFMREEQKMEKKRESNLRTPGGTPCTSVAQCLTIQTFILPYEQ
jgi:hypothetical protein